MEVDLQSRKALLLAYAKEENTATTISKHDGDDNQSLQFFDSTTLFGIAKDLAVGYLILLSGDNFEYKAPTSWESASERSSIDGDDKQQNQPQDVASKKQCTQHILTMEEESASLAYAAILDGNVLHACFGLKITPNGRVVGRTDIIRKKESTSIFCCFPSSSVLETILSSHGSSSNNNRKKKKMMHLIEMLREVQEFDYNTSYNDKAPTTPLHIHVIRAYIKLFTALVRYHDLQLLLACTGSSKCNKPKKEGVLRYCGFFAPFSNMFRTREVVDPKVEQLQKETMKEINNDFEELRQLLWERLERDTTETAVSVDEC
ncbi:predicted protein [Thalassiosira pseudonana CCMP1335]|uniref:Uncharacterized protein n=1 Tax=Thalassiosira pseudonana TaxID=35128 RepID=B8C8X4_THAPS|nr:predicted protein [Thalassiosira pseudonana CCMP1335]EED89751.1 predicted protein [Thalassiosira pseudonana CCMP1335]|eukprot:scaffold1924_cov197-Alexandrium_tamarense.AAC.7